MKLVEYPYEPGVVRDDITMGGMFPRYVNNVYTFVGAVPDEFDSPALTREYLLSIIHEVKPITEEPIDSAVVLDAYLAALAAAGHSVQLG